MSKRAPSPFGAAVASAPKKLSCAAPFPYMSKAAPRPFGSTAVATGSPAPAKPAPPTRKPGASSTFPPMSKRAPTPFGGGVVASAPAKVSGTLPSTPATASPRSNPPDYKAILIKFYSTHNPVKVAEAEKFLIKYKGKEEDMFAKLAEKYGVQNPLTQAIPSIITTKASTLSTAPFLPMSTAAPKLFGGGTAASAAFGSPSAAPPSNAPSTGGNTFPLMSGMTAKPAFGDATVASPAPAKPSARSVAARGPPKFTFEAPFPPEPSSSRSPWPAATTNGDRSATYNGPHGSRWDTNSAITCQPKNNLQRDALKYLENAKTNGADVTFLVGESSFPAHLSWLRIRLPALAATANDGGSPTPIKDVDPASFNILLRFAYASELPNGYLGTDGAPNLIFVANKYNCTELKFYAEAELIKMSITVPKVTDLIIKADAMKCALLKEKAIEYFAANGPAVMETIGWTKMITDHPKILAEIIAVVIGRKGKDSWTDFDDDRHYKRMGVTKLRRKLEENGLDVDGLREDLVARLEKLDMDNAEL